MNFRRFPFQFTSTDPAKRQAEVQKRFGVPTEKDKMYIDLGNPGHMGSRKYESNSASTSPRLQHRFPIFTEGSAETSPCHDAQPNNVDGRKPRVRVVPIEVEGADKTKRRRNPSGPSSYVENKPLNGHFLPEEVVQSSTPLTRDVVSGMANKPRVHKIPIQIEVSPKKNEESHSTEVSSQPKQHVHQNGCNVSKTNDNTVKKEASPEPDFSISLKKIETVLGKLKVYEAEVEKFSGTTSEKQYRYLDEMLTRCMLDLDDVDTMGNENVRLSRKAAIKKVQYCIDLLESKVSGGSTPEQSTITEASASSDTLVESCDSDAKMEDVDMVSSEETLNQTKKTESTVLDSSADSLPKMADIDMVPSEETVSRVEKTDGTSFESSVDSLPKMADVDMTSTDEATNQTVKTDDGAFLENCHSISKGEDIDFVPSEVNENQTVKNESAESRVVVEITELKTEDVEMEENCSEAVVNGSEILIEEPSEMESVPQVMELDQKNASEIKDVITENESCTFSTEDKSDKPKPENQTDIVSCEITDITLENSSPYVLSNNIQSVCDVDCKDVPDVKFAVINEMTSMNNISNSLNNTQSNTVVSDVDEHSKEYVVKSTESTDGEPLQTMKS